MRHSTEEMLTFKCKDIDDTTVAIIASNCPNMECLYLNGCSNVTYKSLDGILPCKFVMDNKKSPCNKLYKVGQIGSCDMPGERCGSIQIG
jgi:hypothetical protein